MIYKKQIIKKTDMKTLRFIVLFTCGFCHLAVSQDNNKMQDTTSNPKNQRALIELPQIAPPLPTSAIYQRYGATPPNLSTGTVNINIPLYTLKVNGFELPFSLDYQTSGIKLMDPFLPLGYGWVFSPGLRITRVIMGNADDKTPRSIRSDSELSVESESNFLYLKSLLIDGPSAGNIVPTDAQYDIFSIHLHDINVRFLMNKENNNWKAISIGSAVKITPVLSSSGEFNGFDVTDDKGVVYQFGETASYSPPVSGINTTYIELNSKGKSSWLLRKIILPGQNNSITFNWNAGVYGGNDPINDYYTIIDRILFGPEALGCSLPSNYTDYYPDWSYDALGGVMNPYNCMYLKDVQFPSGKIEIVYGASNTDRMMKTMKIYSNNNGNYTIVKDIVFNTSSASPKYFLKGVTIGQDEYKFEYDESIPYINLNAMDWWGYFNGRTNVTDIPRMSFLLTSSISAADNFPATIGEADRAVVPGCIQQNILKKVIYPTKGYSKYEYEVHKFNGSVFQEGGGLRVKKIITKESDNAPEVVMEYRYGSNESGLGICTKEPVPSSFFYEQFHYYTLYPNQISTTLCYHTYRQLNLLPDSKISFYTSFNPAVWYDVVTEYSSGGKTVYRFEYIPDDSFFLQYHTIPVNPSDQTASLISCFRNLFNQGPRLRYKEVYTKETSGNYKKLLEEENQYSTITAQKYYTVGGYDYLTGLYVERKLYYDNFPGGLYDYSGMLYPEGLQHNAFVSKNYRIMIETQKISAFIKKDFDPNGNMLEQRTSYTYVMHDGTVNLSSETTTSSTNKTLQKQMLYPLDNLSMLTQEQKAAAGRMAELNLKTTPLVEIQTFGESSITKINQYKDWGNNLLLPQKLYMKIGNGIQENRITYNNYDIRGNLLYLTKDDADKVVYLWGYNYRYPIAEIKGATYTEVTNKISASTLNTIAAKNEPATADWTSINNLRTQLPNAIVTTYTYKPLVGILTMTDPRGVVTDYEYDTFGRLNKVTQADRLIEKYDYHYKN